MIRARVLLWIPFALLLAADALAQCRVEGVVRSTDGAPMAAVDVLLEGPDYKKPLATKTDAEGRYVFEDVKAGARVRLVASRGGRRVADTHTLVTLWVETVELTERPAALTPTMASDVLVADGPSGALRGVVRSTDGKAVERARVRLGETAVAAPTDAAGRFQFAGLRPGMLVPVNVTAAGFEPATRNVVVPDSGQAQVDFALAIVRPEEDAAAQAAGENETGGQEPVPGPLGLPAVPSPAIGDMFRRLQFLPAVAASLEPSDRLEVRGGASGDTRITYDGFVVYPFSRTAGVFGGLNADAVGSGRLEATSISAAEGGALAGALRLEGLSNGSGRAAGSVEVDMLGAGGFLSLPVGSRASVLVAGRHTLPGSIYEDSLDRFSSDEAVWVRDRDPRFSGGPLGAAPDLVFRDLHGRLDLRPGTKDRLVLSGYDARDGLNASRDLGMFPATIDSVVVPDDAFRLTADAVVQVSDVSEWDARGLSGSWERQWSPTTATSVSFGRSETSRAGQQSSLLVDKASGRDLSFAAQRGGSSGLSERNELTDTTLRAQATLGIGFAHLITVGGELKTIDLAYDLDGETFVPSATGSTPSTSRLARVFEHRASGQFTTVFAQDDWRPAARLTVTPGVRMTRYDVAEETYLDPRVSASYQLTPDFRVKGGWSVDHQAIGQVAREDFAHGDGAFWMLSDGTQVPVASARSVFGGGTFEAPGVVFDFEFYRRSLDDLSIFAPRLLPGALPTTTTQLFHQGSGTAIGLEATVTARTRINTFLASYAGGRLEHTFPTLEPDTFRASGDRPHEFKAIDTIRFGGRWALSGAWVIARGRPYTPASAVETVWFPSGVELSRVTFGAKNSQRLPVYHRLDLLAQGDLRFGRARGTVGAGVFNVYGQQNLARYDYQVVGESVVVYDILMMGRAFNVFFKVAF